MTAMPKDLAAAIAEAPLAQNQDRLDRLREMVARARELELEKAGLEERLEEISRELDNLYWHDLPTLMDEAAVSVISLSADGNLPEVEAKAQPFYAANIAVGWPPERRQAAFGWLDQNGHGDLIKTEVVISFSREERARALQFAKKTAERFRNTVVNERVHTSTLTAWLREQVESGHSVPLDLVGGTVTRVVKLKTKN